ncbi:hypothetical protein LTR10_017400 [Elasticomyces elasticus]|uniref:Protein HRI1 n=1 Tax=Exophiala sideris TaxID=1016849 RepID=A0ABR0J9B8_9EURO|nr:hypothetical protein LTR10_017400 [Elasticomyces elasticus]KAK5027844.1 hypothetical protein LTS07_006719 [Exophiala sideris]KAK5037567.1 hypothetical protein LTR13_004725 [Exophiala sideris]KAK5059228.1 hypothetical protein LTR69_006518 [Exophiala sideris]KAK5183062.1 hypothetical protein LTR44_004773 [Eurotiomycetes sp. CCFEE 6388]
MEIYGMTGEKLGTIGNVQRKDQKLPQWKKDFLKKPSISVREGIAWQYSSPYEETSTLVLTSPESVFVDLRFPDRPDTELPLTSDPSFWAFSGTSETSFDRDDEEVTMPYLAHAKWKHEIDSKGPGINDEGDMFMLPNGDCIEVGMMMNPDTRTVMMYKEYWTTPSTEPGSAGIWLGPGSGGLRRTPCFVARTQGADESKSGVIIRVGDFCQGIARHEEKGVLVERWQRIPTSRDPPREDIDGGDGVSEWSKDWRSNTVVDDRTEGLVPCMWICRGNRRLGDEVVVHGIRWKVVEALA